MKKYILLCLLMFSLCFAPIITSAKDKEPINIYLFRGRGCGFCQKFLNYVNDTLSVKYGNKYNLVSYEVWYDETNPELMTAVRNFLGSERTGVPFIVIGDKYFDGYSESFNADIEAAIETLYDSDNRYDVFEAMEKDGKEVDLTKYHTKELSDVFSEEGIVENNSVTVEASSYSKENSSTAIIVLLNLLFTVVSIATILIVENRNKKTLLEEISKLKK